MSERNTTNRGKRERSARKRHRRAQVWTWGQGRWLKIGRVHAARWNRKSLAVADAEKSGEGVR